MLGHTLLPGPLGTEETMKRQWQVRREAVERPDAQGRWDRAYQFALRARTARRSTMRVAAYVRVSTSRQVKLETIEQQLEMVRRHAREQGWDLSEEDIFRDDGYSGTTLGRPALDALRDRARLREFQVVVVPSPDRLARNYVHQVVLIEEFEKDSCRVEFVERPMSSEPNAQLLLQIRGAVAEYERTLLAERMRRGRLAKYKAGLLLWWTHVPYGLRVDPDRPRDPAGVSLDETKAAVVAEIFAAYLEPRASLFGVSRHLREMGVPAPRGGKAWSTATLRGILTNPVYVRAKSTPGACATVPPGSDARLPIP